MSAAPIKLPYFMGLAQAPELRDALQAALGGDGELVLDGGSVESADSSCLQLLCAFAAAGGDRVRWSGASAELREAARLLGVSAIIGIP